MRKTGALVVSSVAAVISVFALVYSLADVDTAMLKFSADSLLAIFGTLVTAVAFVLGSYFAIMSMQVFEVIEKQVKKIQKIGRKAKEADKSVDSILHEHSQHLITTIEYQIALEDNLSNSIGKTDKKLLERLQTRRIELMRMRARLGYKFPYLDVSFREKFLLELSALGTREDLAPLAELVESDSEADEVKEIARGAISKIEDRLAEAHDQ